MPLHHGPILESHLDRGVLVVTCTQPSIQGETIAEQVRQELLDAVDRAGVRWVVVDLTNVRYLSSIAFWPLLSLRRRLQQEGGRLLICGLTGAVADVFHTTRMVSSAGSADAPFEVVADRAEAVPLLAELAKVS
jgi:anti-anti-sigma factor